ncbi:MAG: hypothetical protein V4850_30565 [Myxococcota bacterium]
MPAYHQMGHHSTNLIFQPELAAFRGAILSPVNEDQGQVAELVPRLRAERPGIDVIFDPQLYFPQSNRGQLRSWSHFPNDLDTADLSSKSWWSSTIGAIASVVEGVTPDAVCSPAVVPRVFSSNDYYLRMVEVGDELLARRPGCRVLQTVLVGIDDMTSATRAHEVASMVSKSECTGVFLVVCTDVDPRRELNEVEGLKGVMRLINLLESGGQTVLVGFCSTEMALWKAAGATSCATGKFFNIRRFTRSRFEEPSNGGGQLAYWFEEALFAYLRESDVARVRAAGAFSDSTDRNPFTPTILTFMQEPRAWVGQGWRQYMWWFADFEQRADRATVRAALKAAEDLWRTLEEKDILMEERQNDGNWLRQWRRAIAEFSGP